MAHVTSKSYFNLQKRLDMAAQGAPASDSLFKILKLLFTEEEAGLVSVLPLNFFTAKEASKQWNISTKSTKKILDKLADKGILLDLRKGRTQAYILAPTMAGFFEFSLMRTDGMFNRKILSELFYQYINVEEEFVRSLFMQNPPLGRIFVQEDSLQKKHKAVVLDYEKASQIIQTASCITVGTCYCRHKMEHLGKACDMPQEVCLTFNKAAESLVKHKIAKKISKKKAMDILNKCVKLGLVQFGDNVQEGVNFICNCCGCCCEAALAYKRFGYREEISSSNFISKHSHEECVGCGACVKRCPVDAIKLFKHKNGKIYAKVNQHRCIGCGVCIRFCPTKSRVMEKKGKKVFVPKDSFERYVLAAIDSGTLQNYLFDNQNLLTHAILRKFLGTILKLKPVKMILAKRQLQSRFLNAMTRSESYTIFNKLYHKGKKENKPYSHPELTETFKN